VAARVASRRARGADSESELSELFFSGAASDGAKSRPRHERSGKGAGARRSPGTNGASLFD
jgi:hypothetical protein